MAPSRLRGWLSDKEHRYAIEKWFWIATIPVLYLHCGLINSPVAVVSLLSVYALVITAGGAQQAARAAKEAMTEEPK